MSLKLILKNFLRLPVYLINRLGLIPRRLIVRMDGGICSQIHFYLVGCYLKDIYQCDLRYDTTWFVTQGTDIDGKHKRNFELLKLFPSLRINTENQGLFRQIAISFFFKRGIYNIHDLATAEGRKPFAPPRFLGCYFVNTCELVAENFRTIFKIDINQLPDDNIAIRDKIVNSRIEGDNCAVHVRRGDLSRPHIIYGNPADSDYFVQAMSLMSEKNKKTRFFVFSDESEWFEKEVLPTISNLEVTMVKVNDSSRAYCDLILMSLCKNQITSHGSMGKYAAMLRSDEDLDGLVMLPENESSYEWQICFKNSKIL